jgi:hypothetical protein
MTTFTFENGSNVSDQALIGLAQSGARVDAAQLAKARAAVATNSSAHPMVGRKGRIVSGCRTFGLVSGDAFTIVAVRPGDRHVTIAYKGKRQGFSVQHVNRLSDVEFNLIDSNGKVRCRLVA